MPSIGDRIGNLLDRLRDRIDYLYYTSGRGLDQDEVALVVDKVRNDRDAELTRREYIIFITAVQQGYIRAVARRAIDMDDQ